MIGVPPFSPGSEPLTLLASVRQKITEGELQRLSIDGQLGIHHKEMTEIVLSQDTTNKRFN